MGLLRSVLRKIFLVREIISRGGDVHFQRYRLLSTPWGSVFVHHILRSDEDDDPHSHPWQFTSLILGGGYLERLWGPDDRSTSRMKYCPPGTVLRRGKDEFHRITLVEPTWSLVVTSARQEGPWGYLTRGGFVDHETYRQEKNARRK